MNINHLREALTKGTTKNKKYTERNSYENDNENSIHPQ